MTFKLIKVDHKPCPIPNESGVTVTVATHEAYNDLKEWLKSGRTLKSFDAYIFYNEDGDWMVNFNIGWNYDKKQPNYTWTYGTIGSPTDARWELEKFRTLYTVLLKSANDIAVNTSHSTRGNTIVASERVVNTLESLDGYELVKNVDSEYEGKLGIFKILKGKYDGTTTYDFAKVYYSDETGKIDLTTEIYISVDGLENSSLA